MALMGKILDAFSQRLRRQKSPQHKTFFQLTTGCLLSAVIALLLSTGCSHTPAPIEERSIGARTSAPAGPSGPSSETSSRVTTRPAQSPAATASQGSSEINGDTHIVRKGETLYGIAFRYGLDYRDLANWNDISAPYRIYTRQRLRIEGPVDHEAASHDGAVKADSGQVLAAETPMDANPETARTGAVEDASPEPQVTASQRPSEQNTETSVTQTPQQSVDRPVVTMDVLNRDPDKWLWPTDGQVSQRFNPAAGERKGIIIGGSLGQPVVATAAGQVVYSGNGLIGYGELVIIKHSSRLLSAYAHNSRRLVNEGDLVAAGQAIAELGQDGRGRTGLHFEVRRSGQPVDPLGYLPRR